MTSDKSLHFFILQLTHWEKKGGGGWKVSMRALVYLFFSKVLDGRRSDNETISSFPHVVRFGMLGVMKPSISWDRLH